ncbi:MAG: agmatine/peptidylarginine deiminase [Bradymonadia bacterium]
MPAEWSRQKTVWIAWPHDAEEWGGIGTLAEVQREWLTFAQHLGDHQHVDVLVPEAVAGDVANALGARPHQLHTDVPYDDIWLRDTAPLFTGRGAMCFQFNGWGGKFPFEQDKVLAAKIGHAASARVLSCNWVMEGGAVDVDGEGTALTTTDCVLNPNRWAHGQTPSQAVVEARLSNALGVSRVIWLTGCLPNDHTDGHVDTLARFVAPGHVVCMRPGGPEAQRAALQSILDGLEGQRDAQDRPLQITLLPTPPVVLDAEGQSLPATYANFYIGNGVVIVPAYGHPADVQAREVLAGIYTERVVISSPAAAILRGGGSFHCITQQQPEVGT